MSALRGLSSALKRTLGSSSHNPSPHAPTIFRRAAVDPATDAYPAAPTLPPLPDWPFTAALAEPGIAQRRALDRHPGSHLAPGAEHPRAWSWPHALDNPACPWLRELKAMYANPLAFPWSMSPECGLLLHSLALNLRPRIVVETGTFIGISTVWLAAAMLEDSRHSPPPELHAFDAFGPIRRAPWRDAELLDGVIDFVAAFIARAGVGSLVTFHQGNSWFELDRLSRELLTQGRNIDLALIDADHTPEGVVRDFAALEPALATGGLILLHDTFPEFCGGHLGGRYLLDHANEVSAAFAAVRGTKPAHYQQLDLGIAPLNYGLGVLRRIA